MLRATYLSTLLTLLFVFYYETTLYSQVGIGTTLPDPTSILDLSSTNKGFLVPRINIANLATIAPITGGTTAEPLLVWNTNTTTGVGFHYWDGSNWIPLSGANSGDWSIVGNANTNIANNFLGTTNNVPLAIRTNNTERIRVLNSGNVGIGDTTPLALLTVGNGDLMRVISTGHIRTINGTAAAPSYSFTNDTNSGLYHSALDDDISLATGGIQRLWVSDAGEVYAGTTAPVLPGDMFNVTATNINATTSGSGNLTWAVNGYTQYNGGAIYGLRLAGSTGTWGAGQFELGNNVTASRGVYGLANTNAQYGVNGFKPAGGIGWGGLFYNDLGYTGFFGAASDRRLKKNIKSFEGALTILTQLPIYSYSYNTEDYDILGDESLHYGVMADELKQLVPDLVKSKTLAGGSVRSLPENKQPRGIDDPVELVNYIELIPIAIQAIKEQQTIIESQNEKIERLERKLRLLEEKVDQLINN